MKKAFAYYRYSSDNQRAESIAAQRKHVKNFALNKGIIIVSEYVDEATSGTKIDGREQFQQMMNDINLRSNRDVEMIIVHKNDRFSRKTADAQWFKQQLKDIGVSVVASQFNFETDTPQGFLGDGMQDLLAEYYSRNLAIEINKGLDINISKGYQNNGGNAPLGYKYDLDQRKIVIDEHNSEAIKLIFKWFLEDVSYAEIARRLNAKGFRTGAGNEFRKNSFYDMLVNHKYTGTYAFGVKKKKNGKRIKQSSRVKLEDRKYVVEGAFPAIIDERTFERVQTKLKSRRHGNKAGSYTDYLLTGSIYCEYCGSKMCGGSTSSTMNKIPIRYFRYRCYKCKENKSIRKDYVEKYVFKIVFEYLFNENNLTEIRELFVTTIKEKYKNIQGNRENLLKEIKETDEEINNILTILKRGEFRHDTIKTFEVELDRLILFKNEQTAMLESLVGAKEVNTDINMKLLKTELELLREDLVTSTASAMPVIIDKLLVIHISIESVRLCINLAALFSFDEPVYKEFSLSRTGIIKLLEIEQEVDELDEVIFEYYMYK